MFGFLFWLFFIGIVVACFQDVRRREIDNWLNLFLVFASLSFVFYSMIFSGDFDVVFLVGISFAFMFLIMNLFYYGRVFAGGGMLSFFLR